jgi:hypothetical protein
MRRGASFVAKILRGGKPADLPVEEAERFEFLTVSPNLLAIADEVIE